MAVPDLRARLMTRGLRIAAPMPDAVLAMIMVLAAAADFVPHAVPPAFLHSRVELLWILVVEGGLLLTQGTLIDIATSRNVRRGGSSPSSSAA